MPSPQKFPPRMSSLQPSPVRNAAGPPRAVPFPVFSWLGLRPRKIQLPGIVWLPRPAASIPLVLHRHAIPVAVAMAVARPGIVAEAFALFAMKRIARAKAFAFFGVIERMRPRSDYPRHVCSSGVNPIP